MPKNKKTVFSQVPALKQYRYLITGGCGFIGTSLITALMKENPRASIRVLDNMSIGTRENLSRICDFVELHVSDYARQKATRSFELLVGDVRDRDICLKACERIDVVVHLAANTGVGPSVENPRADMESNVLGTFNMLEAANQKSVEKFIFASSGAPLGEVEPPIHEEKAPRPVSPYGASKLAGEGYCSAFYRSFGLKTVSLRFGNVYGPRSKHKSSVVAKFFKQALAGETLEIYGDGNQTRDFIYIDDLINAICLAVNPRPDYRPWGEVFQIATYKETTVNEIAFLIKELVEKATGRVINIKYGDSRVGDVKRNYSDISKARTMLGFEPKFDLRNGLRETFEYFK